jgi:hypothetical protein
MKCENLNKLIGIKYERWRDKIITANVLRLNADFVLHKICDLGAVSGVRGVVGSQFCIIKF